MAKSAKKTTSKAKAAAVPANAMDYGEHEKTYELFIKFSKWSVAGCVALLLGMMVGFFLGGGLVGGTLVTIILLVVAFFLI